MAILYRRTDAPKGTNPLYLPEVLRYHPLGKKSIFILHKDSLIIKAANTLLRLNANFKWFEHLANSLLPIILH